MNAQGTIPGTEIKVACEWFKRIGYVALWYAAIAIVSRLVVGALLAMQGESGEELSFLFSSFSTEIFMLVIGIVLSLGYTKAYLSLGVTRRQLACGVIIAVCALSVCATVFHAGMYLVDSLTGYHLLDVAAIPQQMLVDVFSFAFFYFVGCLIAIGFGYRRVITSAGGIIIGVICMNLYTKALSSPMVWGTYDAWLPYPAQVAVIAIATIAFGAIIIFASKKVVIKAS